MKKLALNLVLLVSLPAVSGCVVTSLASAGLSDGSFVVGTAVDVVVGTGETVADVVGSVIGDEQAAEDIVDIADE